MTPLERKDVHDPGRFGVSGCGMIPVGSVAQNSSPQEAREIESLFLDLPLSLLSPGLCCRFCAVKYSLSFPPIFDTISCCEWFVETVRFYGCKGRKTVSKSESVSEFPDRDRLVFYRAIQSVRENEMDLTVWLDYFPQSSVSCNCLYLRHG